MVIEDLDSISYGIDAMLRNKLKVAQVVLSQYCDDAYLKFLKAERDHLPFDLIITDLCFTKDHRDSRLPSGNEFIKKVRDIGSRVPIIVCSVEDKPTVVKKLMHSNLISGYVLKGRKGLKHLMEAIQTVNNGESYLSQELADSLKRKDIFEIEDYDVRLLLHLSEGWTQDEISKHFHENNISPSSLSSIEKKLNRLKDELKAKNTIQLVATAKDLGLI